MTKPRLRRRIIDALKIIFLTLWLIGFTSCFTIGTVIGTANSEEYHNTYLNTSYPRDYDTENVLNATKGVYDELHYRLEEELPAPLVFVGDTFYALFLTLFTFGFLVGHSLGYNILGIYPDLAYPLIRFVSTPLPYLIGLAGVYTALSYLIRGRFSNLLKRSKK